MDIARLKEETRSLLKRIVECQAYRQLMAANIRGHALKFVTDLEEKIQLVEDLHQSLAVFRDVRKLYDSFAGADMELAVRGKMERIPYPTSRMDLAICLVLCDRAERLAAESYVDCICEEFASIARSLLALDRTSTKQGEQLLTAFCEDGSNRPLAQQMFNRWLAICLLSLGRPGTSRDARAVELKLRSRSCAESIQLFLEGLEPFVQACGLHMPDSAALGVELPAGLTR